MKGIGPHRYGVHYRDAGCNILSRVCLFHKYILSSPVLREFLMPREPRQAARLPKPYRKELHCRV